MLTGLFALVGLLLTVLGLYGMLMLEVRQRRRELTIPAALGADWRRILGLVLRRGLVLTGAGAAAGLLLFRLAGQVLEGQRYEVRPEDGGTAGVLPLVLAAVRSSPVEVPREP